MRVDAPLLLGAAIGLLYLKDCLLWLRPDEAVLLRGRGGRWRAGFGRLDWRLRGRAPWLCNPFTPHRPLLRLRWDAVAAPRAGALLPATAAPELDALRPWVWTIWLLLFAGLPLAFYGQLGLPGLCVLLAVLYASIVAGLVTVCRRRVALGLERPALALLAFEVLACPPYAANLLRRLALARPVDEDLLAAGARLLDADARAELRDQCRARIDDELDWIAEDSARAHALRAARSGFDHEQH